MTRVELEVLSLRLSRYGLQGVNLESVVSTILEHRAQSLEVAAVVVATVATEYADGNSVAAVSINRLKELAKLERHQ